MDHAVARVLRLVVLLCFLLHRAEAELASLQCDAPVGSQAPLLQFCAGEVLSSTSFVADPEMRTFEGVELITFTAVLSIPHLYMASRYSSSACWGKFTRFGEMNTYPSNR